ncbi:MAG: hypothetical protein R3C45_12085 [Phycisphaerales bacterium]
MTSKGLRIMVLAGGPDRERAVSLVGGGQVAAALRDAGHDVLQRDIMPDDLSALDEFTHWNGDAIFPVLHGRWGEGGGLQRILSDRDLAYVGSGPAAASLCINKHLTKLTVAGHGVKTPEAQLILPGQKRTIPAPVVIKALEEGSTSRPGHLQNRTTGRRRANLPKRRIPAPPRRTLRPRQGTHRRRPRR